jgi:hypothetical protein
LGIALSLIAFAAGGSQYDGLNLIIQQIRAIGARQWLGLMAGSIVGSAPAIAPLTERIARSLPRRAVPPALVRAIGALLLNPRDAVDRTVQSFQS